MANSVSNILIVLASPIDSSDQRLNLINKYCKSFAQICTNNGINVDIIDLYNESEINICNYLKSDDSKVLEYQIRITKADEIVFFHPVMLDNIPSILKGFLEIKNIHKHLFNYKHYFAFLIVKSLENFK